MNQFSKQAVIIALNRMFQPEKFFDICALKEILTMMRIHVPEHELAPLRLLHCVHYRDMPAGFRTDVANRVMELLSRCPEETLCFDGIFGKPEAIALPSPVEPKKGFLSAFGL